MPAGVERGCCPGRFQPHGILELPSKRSGSLGHLRAGAAGWSLPCPVQSPLPHPRAGHPVAQSSRSAPRFFTPSQGPQPRHAQPAWGPVGVPCILPLPAPFSSPSSSGVAHRPGLFSDGVCPTGIPSLPTNRPWADSPTNSVACGHGHGLEFFPRWLLGVSTVFVREDCATISARVLGILDL